MSVKARDISEADPDLWRALASPWRRRILDALRDSPSTTSALCEAIPELSRFAVMQHLGVLTDAGVVIVERRGRDRINYLNPVPLREWYERWVQPMADAGSYELLAIKRAAEEAEKAEKAEKVEIMEANEQIRTVRLAFDMRIEASAQHVFDVMTQRSMEWLPYSYGEDRVRQIVMEPHVAGQHFEDWGDGRGHLYGQVTEFDPPNRWATRGRLLPGTILDSEYELTEEAGGVRVRVRKVAVGPLTEDEAASIAQYGDYSRYSSTIEKLAADMDGSANVLSAS
jgi:DNA-binding transcriptional ArsR family regulator